MRTIYMATFGYRDSRYFRTRAAAEAYLRNLPLRAWKACTDIDGISTRTEAQIELTKAQYAHDRNYQQMALNDLRRRMQMQMQMARSTLAVGRTAWVARWNRDNGEGRINEVTLYTRASEVLDEEGA